MQVVAREPADHRRRDRVDDNNINAAGGTAFRNVVFGVDSGGGGGDATTTPRAHATVRNENARASAPENDTRTANDEETIFKTRQKTIGKY